MLVDFLFDVTCVVCRQRGALLCSGCIAHIDAIPAATRTVSGVPVPAVGWYRGELRAVIRAAKNYRARAVLDAVAPAIRRLFDTLEPVSIIPIPPSKPGMVRRGYGLAKFIAQVPGRPVRDVLVLRDDGTQRGRSAAERARGRTFRVRGKVPDTAILVDDVVTSGATAAAAISTLADSGCRVVAVVALALVPERSHCC